MPDTHCGIHRQTHPEGAVGPVGQQHRGGHGRKKACRDPLRLYRADAESPHDRRDRDVHDRRRQNDRDCRDHDRTGRPPLVGGTVTLEIPVNL